jgi:hypothetical protein
VQCIPLYIPGGGICDGFLPHVPAHYPLDVQYFIVNLCIVLTLFYTAEPQGLLPIPSGGSCDGLPADVPAHHPLEEFHCETLYCVNPILPCRT